MIRCNHAPDGYAVECKILGKDKVVETVSFNPKADVVIARVEDEKLLGGVILRDWTGASILMHVAGFTPNWLNRDFLWTCFHYPFVQLGCKKVLALVSSGNLHAIDFDKRIGFKEEYRIKDADPLGDLVLMSMRPEECRWLNITPRGLKSNVR